MSLLQAADSEQAVLAAALVLPGSLEDAREAGVEAADFAAPVHQQLFSVLLDMESSGTGIDPVLVRDELGRRGQLETVREELLQKLLESFVPATQVAEHARRVVAASMRRALLNLCSETADDAMNADAATEELLAHVEKGIFAFTQRQNRGRPQSAASVLPRVMDRLERINSDPRGVWGLSTGFMDLDRLLGGLEGGVLVVAGGRPSMGKTAFAMCVAEHVAMQEKAGVLVFSLETSAEQLLERALLGRAGITSYEVRHQRLRPSDWQRLAQEANRLAAAPLVIQDTPGLSVAELRSRARRLKRKLNLGLVVVDYLQLLTSERRESRYADVTAVSAGLKATAMELEIPLIAISQLSRNTEHSSSHVPGLADLRDSGSVEQDADLVLLLYREEYYRPGKAKGIADVIVAKHRNGPTGRVQLYFDAPAARFANLERTYEEVVV